MDNVLAKFGKAVRSVREKKGLSQEKLAELCGLHRTYVSAVERGERNISLINIFKISKALGVKVSSLFRNFED